MRPCHRPVLLLGSGCGLVSGGPSGGPSDVDSLVGHIERVYVEAELARQECRGSVQMLQGLVARDFDGDPVAVYQAYAEAVARTKAQVAKLEREYWAMKNVGDPIFERWTEDLISMHNPEMRRRSQERLDDIRGRYDRVVRAFGPLLSSCVKLDLGLEDHKLFLANDFNASALASLQGEVQVLVDLSMEIDGRFADSLRAARDYLDVTALPTREPAVANPPGK
ncbi:MAG: DUF2959 family protein [Planctomycetota bacterium]